MYFKKLELVGFKSFGDKTILQFEPGITAIVGPNGCGKSNIFDSIRWVLGEQSIKELRGSQSQDVIFNGSDSKDPLGMAEVTLTFDNMSRFFSVNTDEVAITRRLFRSGESEYLLNKQQVRLKDIIDILLGTGIGAESYSLIQQGKIDLVLSSRPEDRRLVFDEASGITKYKSQKREALRRLDETEQNLLRVNDIITEVKRQIGSLERQASKARRYKEVYEGLKNKEIDFAVFQKNIIIKDKNQLIERLHGLELSESEILGVIRQEEEKISTTQAAVSQLQEDISLLKDEIMNLDNDISRNHERIKFNSERISEFQERRDYLQGQIEQTNSRLLLDEEKFLKMKAEYEGIESGIQEKTHTLSQNEELLGNITVNIKNSLEFIAKSKRDIMEIASKVAGAHNAVADLLSKEQVSLARKRRLQIEEAKVTEEKSLTESTLGKINLELSSLEDSFSESRHQIHDLRNKLQAEILALDNINSEIQEQQNKLLVLQSHKEFLEKLRSEYEEIGESMNAVIYLDRLPKDKASGLVIRLKEAGFDTTNSESGGFKLSGEAKPIDLETGKITEKIELLQQKCESLVVAKNLKQARAEELKNQIEESEADQRKQEIALTDKRITQKGITEQMERVTSEEEVVALELSEVDEELTSMEESLKSSRQVLQDAEDLQRQTEGAISEQQNSIASNSALKEDTAVLIAQIKTEIEGLMERRNSDQATLAILKGTYEQDKDIVANLGGQIQESEQKRESSEAEINDLNELIASVTQESNSKKQVLQEKDSDFRKIHTDSDGALTLIEDKKNQLESIKEELYQLQMQNKDLEFKFTSIKDRIAQGYKMDIESILEPSQQVAEELICEEIKQLKDKLDSYGTVNLVAIEEYDELKKRYDFLTQQQNDLTSAKDSLHQAILKINRTTKQMFLETFGKVQVEFRNYFRMLFNGGDAQLFLSDEQDPLESGIEIICRPPGKKLQNVLLLSGGEKSLSAIALIFAIFRIKPAPFCVLDEIDAALDEANVDRFAKMLHEFCQNSQFIVITHNKKTIANADIMYGITMQESGVSRIVSVKFAKDKDSGNRGPRVTAAAAEA